MEIRDRLSLKDFMSAIRELDQRLPQPIEIRAIGGFAMLWHGLRETGVTGDIDTVTPTYPQEVQRSIDEVGGELGFPPDWINNDSVLSLDGETTWDDVDAFDEIVEARYVRQEIGTANVTLYVADLATLAKAKAYAVEDIGIGRTQKDADDLRVIVERLRFMSVGEAEESLPWLGEEDFGKARDVVCRSIGESLSRSIGSHR